jgi:hypothetical protein
VVYAVEQRKVTGRVRPVTSLTGCVATSPRRVRPRLLDTRGVRVLSRYQGLPTGRVLLDGGPRTYANPTPAR